MKLLTTVIFRITLLVGLLFIIQLASANQEQIINFSQQRDKLIEEALRNYRLETQAGVQSLTFGESKSFISEMLELVRLSAASDNL